MPTEPWSWADLADDDVKPRTATVDLCLDGSIQSRLDDARRRKRSAATDDALDVDTTTVDAEIAELEAAAEAATRTFDVESCGHRRWRELITAHPSEHDNERWDAATFVPAAIAECCAQFTSAEQVVAAQERLTTGQIGRLFNAIHKLNEGPDAVPLTRGR